MLVPKGTFDINIFADKIYQPCWYSLSPFPIDKDFFIGIPIKTLLFCYPNSALGTSLKYPISSHTFLSGQK